MNNDIGDRQIRTDIDMTVAARDSSVHLLFNEKDAGGEIKPAYTCNFILSASDALTFSSLLADLAFEVESGLKIPEARKQELVERHRAKLRERIRVMLGTLRERKTVTNAELARKLVDVMSAEVFE